jgi:hypothetical protein
MFEVGCTSIDLIRLKHHIDTRLGTTVPIVILMRYPSVRSLAAALSHNSDPTNASASLKNSTAVNYDPVVTLRSRGIKTPLWLVNPGVAEVLVFFGLAKNLIQDDRPIYALRARGFDLGQEKFASITEAVEVYKSWGHSSWHT